MEIVGGGDTIQTRRISKVHFPEDVSTSHDVSCISKDPSHYEIHLGLLSEHHTYEVRFDMKHSLGDELDIPPLQSPIIMVSSLRKTSCKNSSCHHVTLEVTCNDVNKIEEDILFENSKNEIINLKVLAKVMPNHQGHPALRSGIRLLHKSAGSVVSDTGSDWQGF